MKKFNGPTKIELWILEHMEEWKIICNVNYKKISRDEFMLIRNELNENGFDDVILVLMTNHVYAIEKDIDRFLTILDNAIDMELERRANE